MLQCGFHSGLAVVLFGFSCKDGCVCTVQITMDLSVILLPLTVTQINLAMCVTVQFTCNIGKNTTCDSFSAVYCSLETSVFQVFPAALLHSAH